MTLVCSTSSFSVPRNGHYSQYTWPPCQFYLVGPSETKYIIPLGARYLSSSMGPREKTHCNSSVNTNFCIEPKTDSVSRDSLRLATILSLSLTARLSSHASSSLIITLILNAIVEILTPEFQCFKKLFTLKDTGTGN